MNSVDTYSKTTEYGNRKISFTDRKIPFRKDYSRRKCETPRHDGRGGCSAGFRRIRIFPMAERKYRNVRDQRWGKCIFLNPVPVDVRSIHSQDRMQKNGIYSSSRVNTVFYFLRIIVCKKLCYQLHTTFHIFFICYLCRHVHITKRD